MKIIKKLVISVYSNIILRNSRTQNNRVLFMITVTHRDNCQVLLEYLLRQKDTHLDIYLLMDSPIYLEYKERYRNCRNVKVLCQRRNLFAALRGLTTSKYVFFMHRKPFEIIHKRPEQVVVNLWHGSGYKDAGINDQTWRDGEDFDYVLVPGLAFVETKSKFFACKQERVLPLGYPRYDMLGTVSIEADNKIEQLIHNKWYNKLIIWMPTYRKSDKASLIGAESEIQYTYDLPLLENENELSALNSICAHNRILLIIKRHPFQIAYQSETNDYSNILFVSNKDLDDLGLQLYELLNKTDALISDYSSVAIDYLLLDKPIAFALDDFEQYKDARGFVFDNPLDYMPGHHLYNYEDLEKFLTDIANGRDPYADDRQKLMPQVHNTCDNYCERIWETVQELAMEKQK